MFSQTYLQYGNSVYDALGTTGDNFGIVSTLSADGSTMLVSSRGYDGVSGTEADIGKVSVYQYISGNWAKIGNDIVGSASGDQFGASITMNASGSIIAIGAPNSSLNGDRYGYVRVYQNNSGTWTQLGPDFIGQSDFNNLGSAISLNADGTKLAIGASGVNTAKGEVRVYEYASATWSQYGITMNGLVNGDRFGFSIDLNDDGDFLAVGIPFSDANGTANGTNSGQVQVYRYTSNWNQIFIESVLGENAVFGNKVSLSGDHSVLAVTALESTNFDPSNGSGYVKIYLYNSGTNTFSPLTTISGESSNDRFGSGLALNQDGSFLAVGAPFNDFNGSNSGKVYLYQNLPTGSPTWNIRPGEYNDTSLSGNVIGFSVGISANGGILLASSNAVDPNSITGIVNVYADSSVLGIENIDFENELHIYPNPVNEMLSISSRTGSLINNIKIYDISGRLVYDNPYSSLERNINMSAFNSGTYILELKTKNSSVFKKVIKF